MFEGGGGSIVNTASAAAFYGSRSLAAYGASKAGVVALTRYVAAAYSDRGIRCNAVAPGVVASRELQDAVGGPGAEILRPYEAGHLVGRLGLPEEIAAAVAYLASDDAAFITGETLRIDGGLTVRRPPRCRLSGAHLHRGERFPPLGRRIEAPQLLRSGAASRSSTCQSAPNAATCER